MGSRNNYMYIFFFFFRIFNTTKKATKLYQKYRYRNSNKPLVENNKLFLGIYIQFYRNTTE